MKKYHKIWLENHPERTEEWLRERLVEGFDIHHIDGDKDNNSPDNLVLIEHTDHMRLHGMKSIRNLNTEIEGKRERDLIKKIAKGETCYELKRTTNMTWDEIAGMVYRKRNGQKALLAAKAYANYHGLEWPIVKEEVKAFRMKDYINSRK